MDPDSDYYRQRAEAELAMAQAARHPAAVRAHYFLAGFYLDRAHGPMTPPADSSTSSVATTARAATLAN